MFPFIIKVDNYMYEKSKRDVLKLIIYISPLHFCELMDGRVDFKLRNMMMKESYGLIKSVLPGFKDNNIIFSFYPDVDKITIFDDIPVE
jgi:hypothetical protein